MRLVKSRPGDSDWRAMSLRVALYSKPQYRYACVPVCVCVFVCRQSHTHTACATQHACRFSYVYSTSSWCVCSDVCVCVCVYRFRISKTKYYPQPGVDGALVTFKLLPRAQRPPLFNETDFLRTLDRAFGQRRKMIKNSLQPAYTAEEVGTGAILCAVLFACVCVREREI